uniref:Uncharacterized protein n=1 Tax=Anguilla anguilla TaxID=7936 RepID=A0A0E9T0S8_ANGAN
MITKDMIELKHQDDMHHLHLLLAHGYSVGALPIVP